MVVWLAIRLRVLGSGVLIHAVSSALRTFFLEKNPRITSNPGFVNPTRLLFPQALVTSKTMRSQP